MPVNEKDENYPTGRFKRSGSADEIEVTRPAGFSYPLDVKVEWLTPGQGRDALNRVLGGVLVLEVDHLAEAVAAGKPYTIGALQELGQRPATEVESQLPDHPDKYSLKTEGDDRTHTGPRQDLLLALELFLRTALRPFDKAATFPKWVGRSRKAHAELVKALGGQPVFEKIV
jgi:hypothetical protein